MVRILSCGNCIYNFKSVCFNHGWKLEDADWMVCSDLSRRDAPLWNYDFGDGLQQLTHSSQYPVDAPVVDFDFDHELDKAKGSDLAILLRIALRRDPEFDIIPFLNHLQGAENPLDCLSLLRDIAPDFADWIASTWMTESSNGP